MKIRNSETIQRYIKLLVIPIIALVILPFGTYHHIDSVLLSANIETMEEMAAHDKRILTNSLNAQWDMLSNIPNALKKMSVCDDQRIISCLQINNRAYADSVTMLFAEDGECYRSDGIIENDLDTYELITEYDGKFAAIDITDGKRGDYLLVGLALDDLAFGGRTFGYAVRKIDIDSLDTQLKIDSYGGDGFCSVIDEDGSFILNMGRNGNIMERRNFFDTLEAAEISGHSNMDKLREELDAQAGGLTFGAVIEGGKYIIHIVRLEQTDWYYVSQVPQSVFSSMSQRIFAVVTALLVIIVAGALLLAWASIKGAIRREKENEQHRRQLSEALEMAQQANRAKTDFLNNMSHDIRTSMNAIIGFTTLAEKSIDNKSEALGYLSNISRSSDNLMSLINDILNMSRIESGQIIIRENEENLCDIVCGAADIMLPETLSKRQTCSVDVSGIRNSGVVCDKLRITQVLLNLLSNAVKYTPEGGKITCCVIQEETDGNGKSVFEFRIKDTGIGMSEEFADTVFEPFAREQTPTVSVIQGTGLGMPITKVLVEMMGGTITFTSEQGKGTEFVVRLPLSICEVRGEACCNGSIAAEIWECGENPFAGKRVLLVEDYKMNRIIAAALLERSGIETEVAVNGQEACDKLKEKGAGYYDAVLMDVRMPVMNGYEATEKIRGFEDKALAEIPVIAMTANAFEADKQAAYDCGMDGHIAKPIDIDLLMNELGKAFAKRTENCT